MPWPASPKSKCGPPPPPTRSRAAGRPRALLASGCSATAIICVNDVTAVGALRELRERIGQIICDSLIPRPDQPSAIEHDIVIDPELALRDSTGPAPGSGQAKARPTIA